MEQQTYEMIKELLPRWEIDLAKGTVKTKRGVSNKKDEQGYMLVGAGYKGKKKYIKVHQIIAVAGGLDVVGNDIDHINGNKLDNRLENLEAVSHMENTYRAIIQGQAPMYATAKLNGKAATLIKTLLKYDLMTVSEIAKKFRVSPKCIRQIRDGNTWKDNEPIDLDEVLS